VNDIDATTRKFDYVNELRGIAVLGVLLVHTLTLFTKIHLPNLLLSFTSVGKHGVQLFFFASAFTIFYSYSNRNDETNVKTNFLIRRIFRIAPLYYIALIYYQIQNGFKIHLFNGTILPVNVRGIVENIFFIHGFDPVYINTIVPGGWSIGVEMLFYCLVPILFKYIKSIDSAIYFLVATIILRKALQVIMIHFLLPHVNPNFFDDFLYYSFSNQLPVFALGILFFFIIKGHKTKSFVPLLLLFAVIVLEMLIKIFSITLHLLLTGSFIVLALALSKPRKKTILSNAIQYIGTISYSMYLVHFAVLVLFDKANIAPNTNGPITNLIYFGVEYLALILVTTGISMFTYKYIEVPAQATGKKLIIYLGRDKSLTRSPEILPGKQK
jgi:peptidoglycan/LPS O-acetylase OafA/YrhL